MRKTLLLALVTTLASVPAVVAAQSTEPMALQAGRFAGSIANLRTTRPVPNADVRLMFVDSLHRQKDTPGPGELFVDSAKSRVAVTDSAGNFSVRNLLPGHYLVNVRRLGFEPLELMLTMDTTTIEMQVAMTQIGTILPEFRVTADYMDRALRMQESTGFTRRSKDGAVQKVIDMAEISRRKPTYLTDVLEAYGLDESSTFMLDRMAVDWKTLHDFPAEYIVGIEIYRNPAMLPVELGISRRAGPQTFGRNGNGGILPKVVILWSYIP